MSGSRTRLLSAGLVAAGLCGCGTSTVPAGTGDGAPDAGSVDATATAPGDDSGGTTLPADVVTDTGPADVWRGSLPRLTSMGGPVIPFVRLVTVTFADDPQQDNDRALAAYMVGSPWMAEAGMEYGAAPGTVLQHVRLATPAPTAQRQEDIEAFLAARVMDRTLPRAPDGSLDGVVYMVFYPRGTRLSLHGAPACGFHGYHGELTRLGLRAAYAVIPTCDQSYRGFTDAEGISTGASHELIEVVTDPFPQTAPAYEATMDVALRYPNSSEVGDRCYGYYLRVDGFLLARSWSNLGAQGGGDPCVPIPGPGAAVNAP